MKSAPPPPHESKSAADRTAAAKAIPVVPKEYLYAFILLTSLFALWGFANDVTNPLVRVFREVFLISNAQSSLVQWAFYGGYATMAIPAAFVIRKFSYKTGILVGLGLYAAGALMTVPASIQMNFNIFLLGFYILTFGLAFLETSANPYVLSLGSASTATQRLNLAQAFNPIGSLSGMLVASMFVLPGLEVAQFREQQIALHPEYRTMLPSQVDAAITKTIEDFSKSDPEKHLQMVRHDLHLVMIPYAVIAIVVLFIFGLFALSRMPDTAHEEGPLEVGKLMRRLAHVRYLGGVIAQVFYVGAQIMC